MPVTVPSVPTVATPGVTLLHTPPGVALDNTVVAPLHIERVPNIGDVPFTVTTTVASVPHPVVYPITTAPGDIPVTVVVALEAVPVVAISALVLYHVPAPDASLRLIVEPPHNENVEPLIVGFGVGVIVTVPTVADAEQPFLVTVTE